MAFQIGIQLWQAMEMMKYCSYKNHGNSMCMDCGKVFRTAEQSKHNQAERNKVIEECHPILAGALKAEERWRKMYEALVSDWRVLKQQLAEMKSMWETLGKVGKENVYMILIRQKTKIAGLEQQLAEKEKRIEELETDKRENCNHEYEDGKCKFCKVIELRYKDVLEAKGEKNDKIAEQKDNRR